MKVDRPENFTKEHADLLASLKNTASSNKVNKLVQTFGLSFAEATIFVLYWEKNRG
jgi:hypothetical protein